MTDLDPVTTEGPRAPPRRAAIAAAAAAAATLVTPAAAARGAAVSAEIASTAAALRAHPTAWPANEPHHDAPDADHNRWEDATDAWHERDEELMRFVIGFAARTPADVATKLDILHASLVENYAVDGYPHPARDVELLAAVLRDLRAMAAGRAP